MVSFVNILNTLLGSFALILHCKNLFGGTTIRWTWYFQQFLHDVALKMYEKLYIFHQKVLQITHKSTDFGTIWMQRCSKIVENITFKSTYYHQISFYSVVQVQSYPTMCVVWLQTTPFIFNYRKRMKVVIFLVLLLF